AGTVAQTGNGRLNLARALGDTSTVAVVPAGAPGGGPVVGPYVAAAGFNMTVSSTPAIVAAGSTGNSIAFTFSAQGNNGTGSVSLTVPTLGSGTAWTSPGAATLTVTNVSCTSATLGTVSGNVITINFAS